MGVGCGEQPAQYAVMLGLRRLLVGVSLCMLGGEEMHMLAAADSCWYDGKRDELATQEGFEAIYQGLKTGIQQAAAASIPPKFSGQDRELTRVL